MFTERTATSLTERRSFATKNRLRSALRRVFFTDTKLTPPWWTINVLSDIASHQLNIQPRSEMALLPRRALYLLAEFCGIKLNGRTCRAHTAKGKICKNKRPNGQLFCATHNNSYSLKVGIQKSLHVCRNSQMKFGEYLAIFGETIKTEKLRYVSKKEKQRLALLQLLSQEPREYSHSTESLCSVAFNGPVEGCSCWRCIEVRREPKAYIQSKGMKRWWEHLEYG